MFHEDLEDTFCRISKKEKIILMRDVNAIIGNHVVVSGIVKNIVKEQEIKSKTGC